ncbi:MAG: hypothetical protein WCQ90_03680 [Deltaproteobacteria bacterium]
METNVDKEVRREKAFIPNDMSVKEIMQKYGVADSTARRSLKTGWLIKNYSTNQIIIDRENFHPGMSYSVAKQVYNKRFKNNPTAASIKDDLIQEAVSLMFMQSGKVKEGANERYNAKYGYWWVAFNAMLSYLAKWKKQGQYDVELQDDINPMMRHGNRTWSPEYGWSYS